MKEGVNKLPSDSDQISFPIYACVRCALTTKIAEVVQMVPESEISRLTMDKLKDELRCFGVVLSGKKDDLLHRLRDTYNQYLHKLTIHPVVDLQQSLLDTVRTTSNCATDAVGPFVFGTVACCAVSLYVCMTVCVCLCIYMCVLFSCKVPIDQPYVWCCVFLWNPRQNVELRIESPTCAGEIFFHFCSCQTWRVLQACARYAKFR